jgi:hypothetical protein
MLYTKDEIEKINENATKIRDYLKSLLPKMNGSFSVKFKYDGFNCQLGLYPNMTNPIEGGIGYHNIPWETEGAVNAKYDTTYFMGVMENWQTIKAEFLQEIERRDNTRKAIFNFTV